MPVLAALVALAAPAPAALALAALQLVHQHQALHLTQHVITGPLRKNMTVQQSRAVLKKCHGRVSVSSFGT